MAMLDNRPIAHCPNAALKSTQKYVWNEILYFNPRELPEKEQFPVRIEIDFLTSVFDISVDGTLCTFEDFGGKSQQLFGQVTPLTRIGFFNEEGPAKLSNIAIEIT